MPETKSKKKVRYLKPEEENVDRMLRIPKSSYEKVMEEAEARGLSGSSIVREALKFYLERKPEIKIETLLKDCTTKDDFEEKEGFEIEGKDGFLNQTKERKIIAEAWTEEQLYEVAEKLIVGHDGYFVPPSYEDLINRSAEAMKLNENQKAYLTQVIEELVSKQEETESEKEESW